MLRAYLQHGFSLVRLKSKAYKIIYSLVCAFKCLQCFDAVG